jgi:hypothetical protein
MSISIYIYIYIYIYTCHIYIYIYTLPWEERPRRPAMARLRSSVQLQKAMTTWSTKTTCNGQARVKRPATKGYDDMKQWISSEDATTLPCITIVAALPEHVPNMVSQNTEAPLCHRRMKIVTKYFTLIYTYIGIYIHLIYVVHAPAYASSHQTLLWKNMPSQGRSKYRTMIDALRTEEGAIVQWLMPQELRNERHWQVHCIFNLRLGPATKGQDDLHWPGSGRASRHKRLWRHEAVKLKSSCNDQTVHNKSCCAAWTHVSRDNYT